MDLLPWTIAYEKGWDRFLQKMDPATQERILKKLQQMKQPLQGRGLHATRHHVEEAGQYRIAFLSDEEKRTKYIRFVGTHKQYEEWLAELE